MKIAQIITVLTIKKIRVSLLCWSLMCIAPLLIDGYTLNQRIPFVKVYFYTDPEPLRFPLLPFLPLRFVVGFLDPEGFRPLPVVSSVGLKPFNFEYFSVKIKRQRKGAEIFHALNFLNVDKSLAEDLAES